ncbi:D-aminoacylase [Haliea sp. E1-2-M8]|uniref:N-acyl-D-amino-acid deacylase family protein n=1 Tax=Haliea sp. E1-2-M8 TaxID=3064706 RepID=UPI002717E131|nr:D-aminoacylase [Haliea sp. E1-2-M8]MDO8863207.1 D-aminoacylase [Haliea sp. E1-2-M8]
MSLSIRILTTLLALLLAAGCSERQQAPDASAPRYDLIIDNGVVYDGSGTSPVQSRIAINGDRIVAVGDLEGAVAERRLDAGGLAVAPGFINMLSWATESLIEDGRGLSDIAQGVTLEVFGEGWSMGPLTEAMKDEDRQRQTDFRYDIEWTTLGEYLKFLEQRGVSPNVASFVGATTLRIKHVGYENRPPTADELQGMRDDVALAMEEGAMGVGSSLIYMPAFYADTEELIALVDVAADYGGSYITHMRSEGNRLLEAVDEVLAIAEATGAPVEIYHLKAAGKDNWEKMDQVIDRINAARAEGVDIRANMYTYTAGSTGLNAAMPPWVQEGGFDAWVARLRDPEIRARVLEEIETPTDAWENIYLASGGADNVLLVGFRSDALKPLAGKTLAEIAAMRGSTPAETMVDLVIEDNSRVDAVYFMMSEENLVKQIAQPWMSFQSDAAALAPEGVFLNSSTHPRAYGNFARLLGKYVREDGVLTLREAVRRLTSLPAGHLGLADRGVLAAGYYADIVIFDPDTIQDHATYLEPHQLASGVRHVFVNGEQVLADGVHTGAMPGRAVRGPGYVGSPAL